MSPHDPLVVAALAGVGLIAGVIDGVAGGGGLLTLPALLAAGVPTTAALATNKGQSVFGSSASLARFARSPLLDRARAGWSIVAAGAAAAAGAALILRVPPGPLRPIVLGALVTAAVLVALRRDGEAQPRARSRWLVVGVAALLGFYDGLIGPGTGTFLIVAYAWLWGDPLPAASANAKAANWASNAASLAVFAASGAVDWRIALPMGVGQACGGWLGAHLVVRRGRALVRWLAIAVSLALVAKVAWQMHAG